ncbi:ABC transporter permease [Clostridium vincentii]|uniref:ABC-2 family transporter protein n=1 Tax=Clostridium vincentii TaxID=52704 RepID=A0A2T0BF63_9CLOT|nr:ABC transporter permease [Clostridium vincentii]PRR82535.1 ABC-2 family transporter protein [Clostridium vincentii]
MLLTLVKNNLKLMLRDKVGMLLVIGLPIILIALLSSAFSDLLNKNYTIEPFTVGYSVESGSEIEKNLPGFIKNFEENNITFSKMTKDESIEQINNESINAYVDITNSDYTIYKKEGFSINTTIFENSIGSMMYVFDGNKALMSYFQEKGIAIEENSKSAINNESFVKLETITVDPTPTAIQYYGIVEIAYIVWCSMMTVSIVVCNERKYGVTRRIGLSNASPLTLLFGKVIPAVITVSIQIGIATLASIILMDVNWGNTPFLSAGIILLEIIASSSIAIVLSIIFKSQSLTNVIIFFSAFFFGFIGGSTQMYMYSYVSDNIAKLSPLYYINRSLVEISTKGSSDYTVKCIVLLIAISIVTIIIGTVITAKRREAL